MDNSDELLSAFKEHYEPNPGLQSFVTHMLRSRPAYAEPVELVPLDEYERRLSAIQEIRRNQREFRSDELWDFTAAQFSVLITMPLPHLEGWRYNSLETEHKIGSLHKLLKYFLHPDKSNSGPEPNTKKAALSAQQEASRNVSIQTPDEYTLAASGNIPSTGKKRRLAEEPRSEANKEPKLTVSRNKGERTKALNYDNHQCLATRVGDPHGCHIIPFKWNDTEIKREKTAGFALTIGSCFGLGEDNKTSAALRPIFSGVGHSDKAWNILSLSPTVHSWWDKGYFAFKWHGVLPVTEGHLHMRDVQLQFIWMPRSQYIDASRPIRLEDQQDPNKGLLGSLNHQYGSLAKSPTCNVTQCRDCEETTLRHIINAETGHPLVSGSLITVTREEKTLESFKVAIDLQWALLRAAAMSGAARAPELLVGFDDDDYAADDIIELWRQNVSPGDPGEVPEEVPKEFLYQGLIGSA